MMPIRDTIRSRQFPVMNTTFMVINVLIFFFETSLGQRSLDRFLYAFGLVPARFWKFLLSSILSSGSFCNYLTELLPCHQTCSSRAE
jgi:membrane associated rhomboid family serine protease